ncbi:sorting nexin 25 [Coelomomyces lativittatus]|nr:sorting nexin 25 [Coelomomyces lativittatus]
MIIYYLNYVHKTLWPGGVFRSTNQPSRNGKESFKESASQKLISFIPEILGGFVGRQNATRGALRIHSLAQNPILNRHFMYSLFDILIEELFPEIRNT